MQLPLRTAPESLCILRLSAIGDVCHTLPVVRTLQAHWPETRLTWIIGRVEAGLLGDIPGIEFIIFDKTEGWRAYRNLRTELHDRHFDVMLQMQIALRASVASLLIRSELRLGFDKARAKDYQWLFTNARIAPAQRQHVMDGLFGFTEALGIKERMLRWDIPQPLSAIQRIDALIPSAKPLLLISPCSSDRRRNWRNWSPERYAAVADYAIDKHGMQVALTGGGSGQERAMGAAIEQLAQRPILNLIGQTNLKELLVLIDRASVLIAPDSGPAHIATTVDTPVIGLYVTSNPARTGPYFSQQWVINHYPQSLQEESGLTVADAPWGQRVRSPEAMLRIEVAEVTQKLETLLDQLSSASN